MAIGLVITGLSAYAFLSLTRYGLGTDASTPVNQLWFATFILAPGFFLPVEQEVGRALAHRRALGEGGLPVLRKAALLALGLLAIVGIFLLTVEPVPHQELFDGSWVLFGCLLLAFAGYALGHFLRGTFAGTGRFQQYGLFMASDGLIRFTACAVLAVTGVTFLGDVRPPRRHPAVPRRLHRPARQLPPHDRGPSGGLGRAHAEPGLARRRLGGRGRAGQRRAARGQAAGRRHPERHRVRVQLRGAGGPGAAVHVPGRAGGAAAEAGPPGRPGPLRRLPPGVPPADAGRRGRRRWSGVVLAATIGPAVLEIVFNATVGRRTLTLLALGSGMYMIGLGIAQAVIALHGHAWAAVGWIAGLATFIVVTAVASHDLLLRVELGLVAGSLTAMATFAYALHVKLRDGAQADSASFIDAITDHPLETP